MKRPIDPDLDDSPRIPASWSREDIARELRAERRRCAEEKTANRRLQRESGTSRRNSPAFLENLRRALARMRYAYRTQREARQLAEAERNEWRRQAEEKQRLLDRIFNSRAQRNYRQRGEVLTMCIDVDRDEFERCPEILDMAINRLRHDVANALRRR